MPGFVPDEDLANWYRAAAVFVFPSFFEGFGLPPLGAMACGCSVLASAIGAVAEVCGEAALLAHPEDVDISRGSCATWRKMRRYGNASAPPD